MHPFFKPGRIHKPSDLRLLTACAVLNRDNGPLAEPPRDTLEVPERLTNASHQQGHQSAQIYSNGPQYVPPRSKTQSAQEDGADSEIEENMDIDPNLGRRKRRRTTPFEGTSPINGLGNVHTDVEVEVSGDNSWLAQLQKAAGADSPKKESVGDTEVLLTEAPRTPAGGSPVKLAIRKSPIKTPRTQALATDAPVATPPEFSRSKTRRTGSSGNFISAPKASETPKKKLLKLTSKGKLLSSPPLDSPVSKRRNRSKTTKLPPKSSPESRKATRLAYGTDEDSRKRIGSKIDFIFSQEINNANHAQSETPEPPKVTHPFFLGKEARSERKDVKVTEDGPVTSQEIYTEEKHDGIRKPVAWKDMAFTNNKASTPRIVVNAVHPLWPPKDMQHLGVTSMLPVPRHNSPSALIRRGTSKSKAELCSVLNIEDILYTYAANLQYRRGRVQDPFPLPEKIVMTGRDMLTLIEGGLFATIDLSSPVSKTLKNSFPMTFDLLRHRLLSRPASSRNDTAGIAQSWLSNSAPMQTGQVLQVQSNSLREWLVSHQVSHTATKLPVTQKSNPVRKRRRKKIDELDDFIASSDEDEERQGTAKNAIVITGPHGCGKTASVYAVAKELDFEVFEIYPGMRRTSKDIFDKVGDMTQNHLVQRATKPSSNRESSPLGAALDLSSREGVQGGQGVMQGFLNGKKQNTKKVKTDQARPSTPLSEVCQKSERRKQSLILFDEVDILFDDDKGFWTGVIQLIEQSKRPVILTCNDPSTIPVNDLPIYATLEYKNVPTEVAVDYIMMLAAVEGHQIERAAIQSLYLAKDMDLRATISELDFWCQMAVGSEKGGLDWIVDRKTPDGFLADNGSEERLFSKDTYRHGMGLVPQTLLVPDASDQGALLQHAQEELSIPLQHWHNHDGYKYKHNVLLPDRSPGLSTLENLQQYQELAEARSALDMFGKPVDGDADGFHRQQNNLGAELEGRILAASRPHAPHLCIMDVVSAHLEAKTTSSELTRDAISAAFEPLMAAKPVFPPSGGRMAPSLDTSPVTVITEIAPYVRSIVQYDQRLAEQRDALAGGLQNMKTRRTRAARAAMEGGSKASTREEKWFPKATNYGLLLQTGGAWPQWMSELSRTGPDESAGGSESRTASEATSPAADIEMTG